MPAAATLLAIKWGLKDAGLICVAVLLAALAGARALAAQPSGSSAKKTSLC
ncbi:hypothetical protein MTER_10400 [Mycolicibacter terrae]|uniref:Uncharacterized protein n=1 Tax=Mycolicibacter terrae TaxID=1788 RepID=A0AAD1MH60_9MYCO|nr:hypothetical protein [Mycolicibacter terrae]BBX21629.1 hypothetical protein MTER_10400 [Mycolicibacter terrae]SNV87263.1 Uncharacterised protein [Mycolicibacter terrae]